MCHVLIVDDDLETSGILASAIALGGYRSECANEGTRALQLLHDGLRPGLILLDLSLPGMSGIDVAVRMRTNPDLVSIPIVFATGQRLSPATARILGAEEYLKKPFRLAEVMSLVRRYVEEPRS